MSPADWDYEKAMAHLKAVGFRLTVERTFIKPSPNYDMTPEDCSALNYLGDHESYFGLAAPKHTPIADDCW